MKNFIEYLSQTQPTPVLEVFFNGKDERYDTGFTVAMEVRLSGKTVYQGQETPVEKVGSIVGRMMEEALNIYLNR